MGRDSLVRDSEDDVIVLLGFEELGILETSMSVQVDGHYNTRNKQGPLSYIHYHTSIISHPLSHI